MQSGGERYGMGQADMQAYTSGGGSGGGGGVGGARGLAHLFGHPQTSSDMSGLHTLHLHRPLHQEQQYIDLAQLRGNAAQQAPNFLHPSQLPSTGSYHIPSFFKTSQQAASLSGQQQDTPSHSFFHMAAGHSSQAQDQFKLSNFNNNQLHQEEDASASHNLGRSSWLADETAALLKVRSDMDPSSNAPSLWEDVARKLQELGYQRSPQNCKEKFESFHKTYKKGNEGAGDHAEHQRRELEFSSDFSSEGGHAGGHVHEGGHAAHVQTSDNYDNDDDQEEDPDLQETQNLEKTKKRKMGSSAWIPSKSFFQKLSREIMEKQDALHRAFLETIERKDRERAMREEAYRRQEAARLDREQEIRAQEVSFAASRDAALIAFLEKATGQSLSTSVPKIAGLGMHGAPPLSSSTPSNSASAAAASIAAAFLQQQGDHLLNHQALQDAADMDNSSDLNTKRWPKVEVHALIRLRSGMEPRFREAGPKAHLWQEIAASMACLGFIRSPKRCKEKWENINKYFKKTKDSSKKRPENAKTCPYFHQLDTLYQRGILTSSSSGGGGKLLGKSDNLLEYNTQEDEDNYDMQNAENNMQGSDREGNAVDNIKHAEQVQGRDKEITNQQVSMLDASQNSIFASNIYGNNASNPSSSGGAVSLVSLPQQMDKFLHQHHNEGINMNAGSKKSLHVEMFVKDILDLQQQQHQKLVDEYDRMEQAHELRELERQQIKVAAATAHPHGNTHDNATLMALVHKLAGDSSDLSMSAPSSME